MTSRPPERFNPMIWHGEEEATGVFVGGPQDELSLLDVPRGLRPRGRPMLPADYVATPDLRAVVAEIRRLLGAAAGGDAVAPIDVRHLAPVDGDALTDILGEGEVSIVAGNEPVYQVQESVLTGVWRVRAHAGGGAVLVDMVEVGDVPSVARDAARAFSKPMPGLTDALMHVPGAMNAPAVLAEIGERSAAWRSGQRNHVINFTLLPLTEPDVDLITTTLGRAPLTILSGGYGTCKIMATAVENVWAVQFLNSMGTVILDTVEIGDVPEAARAAAIDFEDSAQRLGEIVEAYLV